MFDNSIIIIIVTERNSYITRCRVLTPACLSIARGRVWPLRLGKQVSSLRVPENSVKDDYDDDYDQLCVWNLNLGTLYPSNEEESQ